MYCGFGLAGSAGLMGQETTLAPTVVTAESLEEGMLLREDLDLFKPESLADLSGLVPGFHVVSSDSAGYGNIVTMRGSGNALFFGPPAVGLTIDGVPQGSAFAYPTELLELEYAQIFRGPRGAYQGVNAPAGLIALQTPGPTEELEMKLTTEVGSYDLFGAAFRSSGPLGGDFSHTMQLYYRERDGYIDNNFLGGERDDRETYGGMAKIFWTPSNDVEAWLSFSAERVDDGSPRLTALNSSDPFEVNSGLEGSTKIERYAISGLLSKDNEWGSLSIRSAYSWWELDPNIVDIDLSPPNIFATSIRQKLDYFTEEVSFSSLDEASVRWETGLFYSDLDNSGSTERFFGPFTEEIDFDVDQLNLAFFANAGVDLTERVSLDGGVRVDYYESDLRRSSNTGLPVSDSQNDVYFSPSLGLNYQANNCLNLFARSGLGIKPAGYTGYSSDPDTVSYDEERNWSNEIGFEYIPRDDLRVSLTGYWNKISDYQVNQSSLVSTDFIIANADEVYAKGVEAEVSWQPISNLFIRGSFGYADTEFEDYAFGGSDFSNNDVPYIPEFTGSLGARYDFDTGFYLQSAVRVTGKTNYDSAESDNYSEGSYAVWNAEIGYRGEDYSIAIYGNNLLDEEYYTFINSQIGPLGPPIGAPTGGGSPGDPQIFGVRLTKEF